MPELFAKKPLNTEKMISFHRMNLSHLGWNLEIQGAMSIVLPIKPQVSRATVKRRLSKQLPKLRFHQCQETTYQSLLLGPPLCKATTLPPEFHYFIPKCMSVIQQKAGSGHRFGLQAKREIQQLKAPLGTTKHLHLDNLDLVSESTSKRKDQGLHTLME